MAAKGARTLHKLTDREARNAKPGVHLDGGGLRLVVSKTGSRSFFYRFQIAGRERDMPIGNLANVTLAQARELAGEARRLVKTGVDPIDAGKARKLAEISARTKAAGGMTFANAVVKFFEAADRDIDGSGRVRHTPKTRKSWDSNFRDYCGSILDRPCEQIESADLFEIFDPLFRKSPDLAKRLRFKVERILSFARTEDSRDQYFSDRWVNPARWADHFQNRYRNAPKHVPKPHRFIEPARLPEFVAQLRELNTNAALLTEFILLTGGRSGQVLKAQWSEIDLDSALWTAPFEHMKGRRAHRIPLSPRAVEILIEMRRRGSLKGAVFSGRAPGKAMNESSAIRVMKGLGWDARPHGLRSSVKTWATEAGVRDDVSEGILAHVDANATRRAYQRSDLLEERRRVLDALADFVDGRRATNVLPLKMAQTA